MSPSQLPPGFDRGVVTIVRQGDCLVTSKTDATYSTILGSCISACIRDVKARVGGMNHFLLADQSDLARDRYGASARYGAYAMERLINNVLSSGTGSKANLEVKIFGGGMINVAMVDIGGKNIEFVREFLSNEGYFAAAEDLGGSFARRVLFKPSSGRVLVKRLAASEGTDLVRAELAIARRRKSQTRGDIELF